MGGLTVTEARAREWPFEWLAEGREEGREEGQLAMLRRLVSRRFGAATAEALVSALAGNDGAARLEAAEFVLDCETGAELLDRRQQEAPSVAPILECRESMDGLTEDADVVREWPELMAELAAMEARANEWRRGWLEAGREEGRLLGQLAMLRRLASHRFGTATAEALLAELASTIHVRLEAAAELILDWETGESCSPASTGNPAP